MEMFIIQINVRRKNNFNGDWILKIHPVKAQTEQQAIEKLGKWYEINKPFFDIKIIDSEGVIE